MSRSIRVDVRGVQEVVKALEDVRNAVPENTLKAMDIIGAHVSTHVKLHKLSNQVLHVRSGNLRRNVNHQVVLEVGGEIAVVVGVRDTVPYGRIHELGGKSGHNLSSVIPARPYLKPSVDENEQFIMDTINRGTDLATKGQVL
jgi:hypothetical protein